MQHSVVEYQQAVSAQNALIETVLNSEEPDTEKLLSLVTDRDTLVVQCLELLEGDERKSFAQTEHKINEDFTHRTELLFSESLKSLSKFVKDAKAVRKYR